MKKLILALLIIALTFNVNAQEKGKVRVGLGMGLSLPNRGAGFGGDLDVRYNILDNLNAGIKFTGDILVKDIVIDNANSTASITAGGITSTLVTGDYYFNSGNSLFAPFLGGGLGLYNVLNIHSTESGTNVPIAPSTAGFASEQRFGGLLRGGFELGHFRMGIEYFLVPNSTLYDNSYTPIGIASNSYVKISVGFYLGGGHWKK